MTPSRLVLVALLAALALPSVASALTRERTDFSDPFDGGASCGTFDIVWEGHDRGFFTDYFDADGNFVKQVGHINSVETDTNVVTGKQVVIRTHITVLVAADGSHSLTGLFNGGNFPKEGRVLHDAGRVEFDENGVPVVFHGIHDTFTKGPQAFCDALS
jgi:hypothetical protein